MKSSARATVKPFLSVGNSEKAVTFYVSAFEAVELKRFETASSKIAIGDSEFYVGDEEPQNGNLSPSQDTTNTVRLVLETRDADEFFNKAIALGATAICPMTTEDDWRIGKLKDPFGHVWEIGYVL